MTQGRQPSPEQLREEARVQAYAVRSELTGSDQWEAAAFDVWQVLLVEQDRAIAAADLETLSALRRQMAGLRSRWFAKDRYENRLHGEITQAYEVSG